MFQKINTSTPEEAQKILELRKQGLSWEAVGQAMKMDRRTAKAILFMHGHEPKPHPPRQTEKWTRPCIICKCTQPRTKGLFRCKACRALCAEHYNAPDNMY